MSTRSGVYVLIHPREMAALLEERAPLVTAYAERQPGAEEVLVDALLERAAWSDPGWSAARREHLRRPALNLFWVGNGLIRQSVFRAVDWPSYSGHGPRRATRRGWKEIDATACVRRRQRRRD